jgi:hypothetical protein
MRRRPSNRFTVWTVLWCVADAFVGYNVKSNTRSRLEAAHAAVQLALSPSQSIARYPPTQFVGAPTAVVLAPGESCSQLLQHAAAERWAASTAHRFCLAFRAGLPARLASHWVGRGMLLSRGVRRGCRRGLSARGPSASSSRGPTHLDLCVARCSIAAGLCDLGVL